MSLTKRAAHLGSARSIGMSRTVNPKLFRESLAIKQTRACSCKRALTYNNINLHDTTLSDWQKKLHDPAMCNLTLASSSCIVATLGDTLPGCSVLVPQGDR